MKNFFKALIVKILEWEARLVLWRFKPKIVAVTGSVGKTTTKDAVATAFSAFFDVRKSNKSFNSELGVPLTILGLDTGWSNPFAWIGNVFRGLLVPFSSKYPEWLVLEVGADRPGDIEKITRWLSPDVAVVSQMSKIPTHVEYFSSPDEVTREKCFLVKAVKKDGVVVLNKDDDDVAKMKEHSKSRTFFFGFSEDADVTISNDQIEYTNGLPFGMSAKMNYEGNVVPVKIDGVLGHHLLYPIAAALTAVVGIKRNMIDAGQMFEHHRSTPGRMNLLPGLKETLIIDDSYNSSPIALAGALFALREIDVSGRKIAVLGDMLELGAYTTDEHKKAGRMCATFCDLLFTVGVRAKYIAEGAREKGMNPEHIFEFTDSQKAGKALEQMLQKGDVILIKGSQGSGQNKIRTERAVKEIMLEPQLAEELLVRQDEMWEVK